MRVTEDAFKLAFEISPILLCGGIAKNIPGGVLPIAAITEGLSIVNGLLQGADRPIDSFSTAFFPASGTTLVVQDVGHFSFLDQATAANAVVQKPNRIVMQMLRPADTKSGGYVGKGLTFTALKVALDKHNQAGGTYTIMTPAFIFTDCLMHTMTDVSGFSEQNKQVQHSWSLEFEKPLLYISQLESVQANLFSKFETGTPTNNAANDLSWSGIQQSIKGEF